MPAQSTHIAVLLAFVLVNGCHRESPRAAHPAAAPAPSTQPVSATQPAARAADRLDVLEAVFRHQFDKNASGGQRNVDYFFLSLDERRDPPAELLARFKDHTPKVLPVSFATSAAGRVRHKDLGGRGLIFRVESIVWLDENTAEVKGGYYEANLSASGNTYRVTRTDGRWKVTKDRMNWIS